MALDAIKRRIPFDRLAHARRCFHHQRIEATSDVALPTRHRRDIGLHRRVALALGDLGIAACEKFWLDLTSSAACAARASPSSPTSGYAPLLPPVLPRSLNHAAAANCSERSSPRGQPLDIVSNAISFPGRSLPLHPDSCFIRFKGSKPSSQHYPERSRNSERPSHPPRQE